MFKLRLNLSRYLQKQISLKHFPLALISNQPNSVHVHIDQLALKLIRELDGKIHLDGFAQQADSDTSLMLRAKLTLHDIQITWQDMRRAKAPITIDHLNAYVEGSDSHPFYGYASLNSSIGNLDFIADIDGNPLTMIGQVKVSYWLNS